MTSVSPEIAARPSPTKSPASPSVASHGLYRHDLRDDHGGLSRAAERPCETDDKSRADHACLNRSKHAGSLTIARAV